MNCDRIHLPELVHTQMGAIKNCCQSRTAALMYRR